MAIMELQVQSELVEHEADELRVEIEQLEGAMESLAAALDEAERDHDATRAELAAAGQLRHKLRDRLEAAEAEALGLRLDLERALMLATVRARLLDDIFEAPRMRRGEAIRRAERVERLLGSA